MSKSIQHIAKSTHLDEEYYVWLAEIKSRYRSAQLKAAVYSLSQTKLKQAVSQFEEYSTQHQIAISQIAVNTTASTNTKQAVS